MGGKEIRSSVSGTILEMTVSRGGNVNEGDEICVVESMKMEISVVADTPGVVAEVLVDTGQPVEEGQAIIVLEQ